MKSKIILNSQKVSQKNLKKIKKIQKKICKNLLQKKKILFSKFRICKKIWKIKKNPKKHKTKKMKVNKRKKFKI